MRTISVLVVFLFILIGCNRMEKRIVWDEFNTNGLPNNYQQRHYENIIFINDQIAFILGNNNTDDLAFNHIETQLYSTSDGGHNWKQVFFKQGEAVCLKRINNTLLILQTIYPKDYRQDQKSTLCISNDLGQHWDKTIELPFALENIGLIDSNYWMGSYEDTVFYTINAGLNWKAHPLLHPKTDNRPVVVLPTGDVIYMSDNKIILENIETNSSKVLKEFSDKKRHYCDEYVYDKDKGLSLIIADSKFINFELYSLSDKKLFLPADENIGIMNMKVDGDTILINGYRPIGRLSTSVFFYSNDGGKHWSHKDFQLFDLPYPVTFYHNQIIGYCIKKNIMIRSYLEE